MPPALSLPPPRHAGEEEGGLSLPPPSAAQRFASGQLILPPPTMRTLVDKTASYIARNGPGFEQVLRKTDKEKKENRLPFLDPSDPYHAYYARTLDRIRRGEPLDPVGMPGTPDGQADALAHPTAPEEPVAQDDDTPPAPFLFSSDMPTTTAMDLCVTSSMCAAVAGLLLTVPCVACVCSDVIKLTALFTAARGRDFANHLLQSENRTSQYDFLRPSHSLHPFYTRLVEQYQLVMDAPSGIQEALHDVPPDAPEGAPVDARQGPGAGGERMLLLAQIRARTNYELKTRERARKEQDEAALEREAFEEIDWQDFVVVQTVRLFSGTDADEDLPPPLSKRDLENMTLAQKKLAAMVEEEAGEEPSADSALENGRDDEAMEMSDEEEEESEAPLARTTAPAPWPAPAPPAPVESEPSKGKTQVVKTAFSGPIRVRKDYVPGAKQTKAEQDTICPVCGQRVPLEEMAEHVRIELLNPMYREQRASLEARQAQHETLQAGADPVSALKEFAGQRTDIFGGDADPEAERRRRELVEQREREAREREALAYDGHLASKTAIMERAKQAALAEESRRPAPAPAPAPIGPRTGLPPRPNVGLPPKPADLPMAMPHTLPARPAPVLGKHAADGPALGEPPAQRPVAAASSVSASGSSTPVTEGAWAQTHPDPVSLTVRMPTAPADAHATDVPACDGRAIRLDPLSPLATFAQVREVLHRSILHEAIGIARIRLFVHGKPTTLKQTLAHWNLTDEDEVAVVIKW